jgi:hypothetical protein
MCTYSGKSIDYNKKCVFMLGISLIFIKKGRKKS